MADNWFSNLFSSDNVANALSGLTSAAASYEEMQRARDIAGVTEQTALDFAERAKQSAAFQPFTVTSTPALGGLSVGAQGDITLSPSAQVQGISETALGGVQDVLGGLLQGTDARTQDIYSRLQQARAPEQARQQAQLQQQMFNQGRIGLGSALYGGGSPEEFARQQALMEQQSKDYLSAMQGAQTEQSAQSNLLNTLMGTAYTPQTQMQGLLQATTPIQQVVGSGKLAGAEALKAAISPVIQAKVGAEQTASDIYQEYLRGLSGMLAPAASAGGTASLGDTIGSQISSGFDSLYNSIFGDSNNG